MAITQTGSILQYNLPINNAGTVATDITVPSDCTFVLVGVAGWRNEAEFFTGGSLTLTKGGTDSALTPLSGGDDVPLEFFFGTLWYMALPDTGTNKTMKWDWQGTNTTGSQERPIVSILFLKDVDTSDPVRDSDFGHSEDIAGGGISTGELTLAAAGDKVVAFIGAYGGGGEASIDSWNSPLTTLAQLTAWNDSDGAWGWGDATGALTPTAATATGFGDGSIVAIALKAAAGGSTAVDGDLQAQAATIDGIVNVIVTAAADLQAQNAQIAGTVSVAIAVTGALEAQAAAISGAVSVIVTVDGDLQTQTASITGAISALITTDGDLQAQASQISGIASIHIAVDGDLEAQAAQIDGTILTGTPISGALAAQDAFIAGIVTVNIALLAAIQAQNAQTAGAIAIALASGGSIASQNASIDGSISTELLRPPKNTFVKRAGWGRSARFWVERDR